MSWGKAPLFAFRHSLLALRHFPARPEGHNIPRQRAGRSLWVDASSFLAKSEKRMAPRRATGRAIFLSLVNHLFQFGRFVTLITFRGDLNHGSKPEKSRH
jgi:hypothetical protein